jgi:hypothetical protein
MPVAPAGVAHWCPIWLRRLLILLTNFGLVRRHLRHYKVCGANGGKWPKIRMRPSDRAAARPYAYGSKLGAIGSEIGSLYGHCSSLRTGKARGERSYGCGGLTNQIDWLNSWCTVTGKKWGREELEGLRPSATKSQFHQQDLN